MNLFNKKHSMIEEAKKAKLLPVLSLQLLIFIVVYYLGKIFSLHVQFFVLMLTAETRGLRTQFKSIPALFLFVTFISIIVIVVYLRKIEGRNYRSMGFGKRHAFKDYMIGYLVGIGMFSTIILILFLTNNIEFTGLAEGSILVISLFFFGFLIQGMHEELLMRGYLMTSIGARHTIWLGVLVSSIIFGLIHLDNPNVSAIAIINIILFGIFAAIYTLKFNNIWGIGALHASWNFVQGHIYGLQVSGMSLGNTIWNFSATGNKLLNGGNFGPEGGLITTIVLLLSTVIVYNLKLKRNNQELN